SSTPEEKNFMERVEKPWKNFEALGQEILSLHAKGDSESMNRLAGLVRVRCPEIALELDIAVEDMITWQEKRAFKRNEVAKSSSETTTSISLFIAFLGVALALTGGGLFASSIV